MRIVYLTKYSQRGASSRLRSIQFFDKLRANGFAISHYPLFSDVYLEAKYLRKKKLVFHVVFAYINRLLCLTRLRRSDFIFIEKELFPYFPSWVEQLMRLLKFNYYVDYDDAIFHNYDLNKIKIVRVCLKNKIDIVMRNSKCVFAGNSYLYNRAINAGAPKTIILPTVIDLEKYDISNHKKNNEFVIGWIGSPTTFKYIDDLFPVFYKLKQKYSNLFVHIVGAKLNEDLVDFIKYIPWTEVSEVNEIKKFNLGLMPLYDNPWELGKCSYKLLQYMACSVAVLGSPVGSNLDVVKNDINGYLVPNNEWEKYIEFYINNPYLTLEHGKNGRMLVESKYNVDKNMEILMEIFND